MNLLQLLHNEKVVRLLENIDNQLKEIVEPSSGDKAITYKIVLMIETLLNKYGSKNGHIGEYFSRYSNLKNNIDDIDLTIKQLKYKKQDLEEEIKSCLEDIQLIKNPLKGLFLTNLKKN